MHQPANLFPRRLARSVSDRDLHVHIFAHPAILCATPLHVTELVGEDFKRNRTFGNNVEDLARERFLIFDSCRSHQGGRSESLDEWIRLLLVDLRLVGAIGKQLDLQLRNASHMLSVVKIQSTASASVPTRLFGVEAGARSRYP